MKLKSAACNWSGSIQYLHDFRRFVYDDLVSTFVHTLITKRKIAQREKLYQEAVAKSDAGAQLLIDELRQYPKQTLQQSLKQSSAVAAAGICDENGLGAG
ncbi:MAG: hypothetical protein ACLRL6_15090 [Clostridium sp.]